MEVRPANGAEGTRLSRKVIGTSRPGVTCVNVRIPRLFSFTSTFLGGGRGSLPFATDSAPIAARSVSSSGTSPPRSKKSTRALAVRAIVEGWVSAWSSSTNVARVRLAKSPLSWRYRARCEGNERKRTRAHSAMLKVARTYTTRLGVLGELLGASFLPKYRNATKRTLVQRWAATRDDMMPHPQRCQSRRQTPPSY